MLVESGTGFGLQKTASNKNFYVAGFCFIVLNQNMPPEEDHNIKKVTETKLILRQSNKISRSPTVPGLRQAKAYRYLLMRAREHLLQEDYHIVYQEELKNFLGSNDWENLKESIEALRKIDVRWDLLPQKGESDELLWGSSPLLADCEIRKEKKWENIF